MTLEGYDGTTVHSSTWIVEYSVQYRSTRIEGQTIDDLVKVAECCIYSPRFQDGRPEISSKVL